MISMDNWSKVPSESLSGKRRWQSVYPKALLIFFLIQDFFFFHMAIESEQVYSWLSVILLIYVYIFRNTCSHTHLFLVYFCVHISGY